MTRTVVVIGAGASGLMAAEVAAVSGARVILLEKMDIPGAKLRLTGNGRCNLANECSSAGFCEHVVPDGRFVRSALARFFVQDIRSFLAERGVSTYSDPQGRVYPRSERASDVLNCLVDACLAAGVEFHYRSAVRDIIVHDGRVAGVHLRSGEVISADAVVICTGGATYPHTGSSGDGFVWAEALGHQVSALYPGLVGLLSAEPWLANLQGTSLPDVGVTLWADDRKIGSSRGGVMFAHDGLSGPAVLSLSLYTARELALEDSLVLKLDLIPSLNETELDKEFIRLSATKGIKTVFDLVREYVPAGLAYVLVSRIEIDQEEAVAHVKASERRLLVKQLKSMSACIDGPRALRRGMVTVGGVSTRELNPRTMQSRIVQGLYMAGEVIDIAGDSGGYNLQMAFSTGRLAGESAAKEELS